MNQNVADFFDNLDAVTKLIAAVPPDGWTKPTPCAGWDADALVSHLVTTQRDFLAERGATLDSNDATNPHDRWNTHIEQLRHLLSDVTFADASYDGFFGPTTVADTLRDFYGWDLIVHRWDLGQAMGIPVVWTTDELDAVSAALPGFGDMLYADGICKPAVDVPPDADEQTKLLARLGRTSATP